MMETEISFKEEKVEYKKRRYHITLSDKSLDKILKILNDSIAFEYMEGNNSSYQFCDSIRVKDVRLNGITIDYESTVDCYRTEFPNPSSDEKNGQLHFIVDNK